MIGFSTGCLYKNLEPISKKAIEIIASTGCDVIELCAGLKERVDELFFIDKKDLNKFEYVSLHAPDDLIYDNNEETLEILRKIMENYKRLNFDVVVIHPDVVTDWSVFDNFDLPIAFENVDRWKNSGKSVEDMKRVFTFGSYKMICDLTHAYTNDSSMGLARDLQEEFKDRICHIHLSGYYCHGGDNQKHYPIYLTKQVGIFNAVVLDRPIIIESVFPSYFGGDKIDWLKKQLANELGYVEGLIGGEKVKKFENIEEGMVSVKIKKLKENAVVPSYAHDGDAAMDLCSAEDYVVLAGKRVLVSTGIAMELPKGYWANIRGKSGLAYKKGISILGGVIEHTYRGEYGVVLLNTGEEDFVIKAGDKVAQVVIAPVASVDLEVVESLNDSVRGEGAWGSTGGSNV